MRVVVLAPDRPVFDGEADAVSAPAYDGRVGILPRHAPFLTMLGVGQVTVRLGETNKMFQVRGGFLQVADNTVRVVAEQVDAEKPDS